VPDPGPCRAALRALVGALRFGLVLAACTLAWGCKEDPGAGPEAVNGPASDGAASPAPGSQEGPDVEALVHAWDFSAAANLRIKAGDAVDLKGLMKLVTSAGDGAPLDEAECFIGCEDKSVAKEDRAEHSASFRLEVAEGGRYYPWIRVWWPDDCGNSFRISIEQEGVTVLKGQAVEDGTSKKWHWLSVVGPEGVTLKEGTCTVKVINTEDGARLNSILFTTRSYESYSPQGAEG